MLFCFFKQKTAYEMRISDWSSDVCSSDLIRRTSARSLMKATRTAVIGRAREADPSPAAVRGPAERATPRISMPTRRAAAAKPRRSEEHTSELQSLMRTSYAVFCLKKKTRTLLTYRHYFTTRIQHTP